VQATGDRRARTAQRQEVRDGDAADPARRDGRQATVRRRVLSTLAAVGGLVLAVIALHGRLPHPADVVSALRAASWEWLVLAGAAQALSMSMFAWQQRRLLGAFGVTMSISRAEAVTYAGSALSNSVPAGAVVSAGFAYRQYRSRGASHRVAAGVMVLSGLLSAAGLAVLYAGWIVARPALAHPGVAGAMIAATGGGTWLCVRLLDNTRRQRSDADPATITARRRSLVDRAARWPWARRTGRSVADAAGLVRTVRHRDLAAALAFAVVNWVGDLGCLIAVARAFGLGVSIAHLAGAYLAIQLVRQIPLTPGGIGLIEASLLVALVAAGAPQNAAAAVVLVYRVLSCWLIVPIGLLAGFVLQSTGQRADPKPPVAADPDPAKVLDANRASNSGPGL
jgi:uncharacterized membrane protein YbhN (UPF0104 family)